MAGTEAARVLAGAMPNPYVGPRPFRDGERLYGREREINELYFLLGAERIVLLHSPSGAGKSSLVHAGLIPRLRERFEVLHPTRVNQELPADIPPTTNRYVLSALQGFEEGIPEKLRRPIAELAGQSLSGYIESRPRRPNAPESMALIFDQFEEVLTVDALDIAAKRAFFTELGELLRNRRIWALFILREDFLAQLDPYRAAVPTRLSNRYRIELLCKEAALQAITQPAIDGGREFDADAAGRLYGDLAAISVQRPDGSFVTETGHFVEPVQLQVVCRRIWEAMPAGDTHIGEDDLEKFGNVDDVLAGYYSGEVSRIAGGDIRREREIRNWCGEMLIANGIREQVLMGENESGGLSNDAIKALVDCHLVRAEKRRGATWFELSHDRLVAPVVSSNEAWSAEHLSLLQRKTKLWEEAGQPAGLLLEGRELADAVKWARENTLERVERRFLRASILAHEARQKRIRDERKIRVQRKWLAWASAVMFALTGVCFGLFIVAKWATERAFEYEVKATPGLLGELRKEVEEKLRSEEINVGQLVEWKRKTEEYLARFKAVEDLKDRIRAFEIDTLSWVQQRIDALSANSRHADAWDNPDIPDELKKFKGALLPVSSTGSTPPEFLHLRSQITLVLIEGDGHEVQHDFLIARYEVTQRQWRTVMGTTPARFGDDELHWKQKGRLPVESVSVAECEDFCEKAGLLEIPNTLEWEHASRDAAKDGWFKSDFEDDSRPTTKPVGSKTPGAPLCDMYGNIAEWCYDESKGNWRYEGGSYRVSKPRDPSAKDLTAYVQRKTFPYAYEYIGFRPIIRIPGNGGEQ